MKKSLLLFSVFLLPLAAFAQTSSGSNFVPLTSLPITQAINTNGDMTSLFNNIYKICIGAAATIAVFQIARAGLTYMTAGDSEEKVSQARKLIQNSILGLVLVLSPFIVFGIVNPDILKLQIGTNGKLSQLTNLSNGATGNAGSGTSGSGTTGGSGTSGSGTNGSTPPPAAQNTYQVNPGTYIWVVGGNSKSNPGCTTLVLFESSDEASCKSATANAVSKFEALDGKNTVQNNLTMYYNCVQPQNGSFTIPSSGLCSSQPYMK